MVDAADDVAIHRGDGAGFTKGLEAVFVSEAQMGRAAQKQPHGGLLQDLVLEDLGALLVVGIIAGNGPYDGENPAQGLLDAPDKGGKIFFHTLGESDEYFPAGGIQGIGGLTGQVKARGLRVLGVHVLDGRDPDVDVRGIDADNRNAAVNDALRQDNAARRRTQHMLRSQGAGDHRRGFRRDIAGRGKDQDQVIVQGVDLVFDLNAGLKRGILRVRVLARADADGGWQGGLRDGFRSCPDYKFKGVGVNDIC